MASYSTTQMHCKGHCKAHSLVFTTDAVCPLQTERSLRLQAYLLLRPSTIEKPHS